MISFNWAGESLQAGLSEPTDLLDRAIETMCKSTRELRKQLKKAVVDHVSDSFLETNVPLLILIEAAKAGNEPEVCIIISFSTDHHIGLNITKNIIVYTIMNVLLYTCQ